MKYDFDKVTDRKGTYSTKWDHMPEGSAPDALPLWVADMDFPCAQPIIDAIHKRVDKLIFGYTMYDNEDLKNAVKHWFKKRYGWDVEGESLFYSPGIVPAVALLINAITEEGDGIIIQSPVYHPFAMKIEANKRKVVRNTLVFKDAYYTMDFEDLDKKMADPNNKGMIFCHPHNPVGRVWTPEEVRKVVDIAKKYNKWIISDEIHADIIRKRSKFTPTEVIAPEYKDEIISLTAPSKTFNMAGLRMSNLVINKKEYREKYQHVMDNRLSLHGVSPFAIAATIAAYTEGDEWLDQLNEYIDGNFKYCLDFFKKEMPKSVPIDSEGTYLFWVDLSAYCNNDPCELEQIMQKKAKVALDEGYIFGDEGKCFERINLACPRSMVADCLNRMKDALIG